MAKTKKVANLAGISATIMDDTLYKLSGVEQQFRIAQIDLIERASKSEGSLIKLCFAPPVDSVIHVVDKAFIHINGFNYRYRDPTLPVFDKKVDQPQIFHDHKFIAMILSSDSCEGLRRTATAEQSLFMEAYAISIDFNKKPVDGSIKVVRPKMTYTQNHDMSRVDSNRLRFAAYPRSVNWQFSERNGFQPPPDITISRSDLYIYGSELKRFMAEVDVGQFSSDEQQGDDEPKVEQNKKPNAILKGQASFRALAEDVEKRAKTKGLSFQKNNWPGIEEDLTALAHAWGAANGHPHLLKATTTLRRYRKDIIALGAGSSQSDFYIELFPEYKELLKHSSEIESKKSRKGK